jgi:hypothetical protein
MGILDEIRKFGGEQIAVHIGARSFSSLALSSLADALSQSVGKSVQLPCPSADPSYAVRLISVNGTTDSEQVDFGNTETLFIWEERRTFLKVVESLKLEFVLGVLDEHGLDAFSAISLELSHLKFQIEASDEQLVCAPGEAALSPHLSRLSDFEEVMDKHSLDYIEVARVEGMLLCSGLATVVRNSMATPQTVDLTRLFPGIAFQGRIEFEISTDQKQLFITGGSGAIRRPESHCECADVGDGIGPLGPGELQPKAAGTNGPENGPVAVAGITLRGPSSVDADSVVGKRRAQDEGDIGLFMPVGMARGLVDGPFPGVRIDLKDEGFIGWKAAAFIDVSDFDFQPDPRQGRFFVTLEFRVEIYGSVHIDLGKLGKIRVTTFSGEQEGSGSNSVKIGFHAVIRAGELLLKPVLEDISFGEFDVHMKLFTLLGTPFGTKSAVIGFILDRIMSQLIAWQLPIRLERQLRAYMARPMFPIMDAYYSAQLEGLQKEKGWEGNVQNLHALYNGRADSGFLFSSGILG